MAKQVKCSKCGKVIDGGRSASVTLYGCVDAGHYNVCSDCTVFLAAWLQQAWGPMSHSGTVPSPRADAQVASAKSS